MSITEKTYPAKKMDTVTDYEIIGIIGDRSHGEANEYPGEGIQEAKEQLGENHDLCKEGLLAVQGGIEVVVLAQDQEVPK